MKTALELPGHNQLFYGGAWHEPVGGGYEVTQNPATGQDLARVAWASAADVDKAVAAAIEGQRKWGAVAPLERARILREMAQIVRRNAAELAMLDAADCGNPVAELVKDAGAAAGMLDMFAGLVTEMKGFSLPMPPGALNFTVREPIGVVARIVPFNHPFLFCAGKAAAPLAAGNSIIIKSAEQAPLSALRLAELTGSLFPPGVFNILSGAREAGTALSSHPDVAAVSLTGSVPTGAAVMKCAADTLKTVLLELGGKNPLIAYPDADPDVIATAAVDGMNFAWCGQSCGSTSRAFIHASIYEKVLERLPASAARYEPGIPTDPATTMGSVINRTQYERVWEYIESAKREGARLICGAKRPEHASLQQGFFVEPTIFADVTPQMRIAREEIFGPVLSVMPWRDEEQLFQQVNSLPYGLTASIWTDDLGVAHRAAQRVESGYIWINEVSRHFAGAPFGGFKRSGIGREECLEELLTFTREKHIHINLTSRARG